MTTRHLNRPVSRRSTVAAMAGGALGLATLADSRAANVQSQPADYSSHPLCGTWLAMVNQPLPDTPQVPAPSLFGADGTVVLSFPTSQAGENGVEFVTPYIGVWEPYDDQTGHFTAIQAISDSDGNLVSTATVDGHPQVSEDGLAFSDDGTLNTVTIRDATGEVLVVIPPGATPRPITAVKISAGRSGFPDNGPSDEPID